MNKEQIAYERGYRVTKDGDLLNPKGEKIGYKPKLNLNTHGYHPYEFVSLKIKGKARNIKTHRLQAYQKYGNKLYEEGIVVRHLNGNSLDNSWDNITIGTQRDNLMDIPEEIRTRTSIEGAKTQIKYPKEFVLKLREEYKYIKNYTELGRKYEIPYTTIRNIINKRKVFKDA